MKFITALFSAAAIVSSALASPIEIVERAANAPPADQVQIKDVYFAGTGCPAGSVSVSMSTDLSNVALLFDNYYAQIGPGTKPADWRKNCNLNFNVLFPQGYTFTVFETEYTGFVSLEKNVHAEQKSEYWFTGQSGRMAFMSQWDGPLTTDFSFKDDIPVASYVYSPCGFKSTLNVNTQIRLSNDPQKKASGYISTDNVSLAAKKKMHHKLWLQWRKC